MITLIYDGTWDGFLTAVFEVYDRKLGEVLVTKPEYFYPDVFGENIKVITDQEKADLVYAGVR